MEDLERAVQKAVDELKELDGRLDQTEQRLAGLRQQVDQAGDRLDDDWQALAQQFDSFFQVVDAEKGRLLGRMLLDPDYTERRVVLPTELVVRSSTGPATR